MRLLASITAIVGCVLLVVGALGLYSTLTGWEILGRSGAMMGLQPNHWRGHWLGTAVGYLALGFTFLFFAVGLWCRWRRIAIAWCFTVSALSAVWLTLFVLQPFPYGFQHIPFREVALLTAPSALTCLLVPRPQHAKAI